MLELMGDLQTDPEACYGTQKGKHATPLLLASCNTSGHSRSTSRQKMFHQSDLQSAAREKQTSVIRTYRG